MDKNTGQLPEGVKWPCYEDGTPVKFGDAENARKWMRVKLRELDEEFKS